MRYYPLREYETPLDSKPPAEQAEDMQVRAGRSMGEVQRIIMRKKLRAGLTAK